MKRSEMFKPVGVKVGDRQFLVMLNGKCYEVKNKTHYLVRDHEIATRLYQAVIDKMNEREAA